MRKWLQLFLSKMPERVISEGPRGPQGSAPAARARQCSESRKWHLLPFVIFLVIFYPVSQQGQQPLLDTMIPSRTGLLQAHLWSFLPTAVVSFPSFLCPAPASFQPLTCLMSKRALVTPELNPGQSSQTSPPAPESFCTTTKRILSTQFIWVMWRINWLQSHFLLFTGILLCWILAAQEQTCSRNAPGIQCDFNSLWL